eukprot:793-Pleurochrysis_carterae.AAC.1
MAAFKPDQSWERHIVEATLRKWVPPFTFNTEGEVDKAKAEWNDCLWHLPHNMKVDDLPELKKLVWPELPGRTA